MHSFDEAPPPRRHTAFRAYLSLAGLMLAPSLLVWIVRGTAFALHCTPGPAPCHGLTLGGGMRDTLDLAWLATSAPMLLVLLGIGAAIAALFARRPLIAGLSALVLPMAMLALPTMAVLVSTYEGCASNEAGAGDCTLWGAKMGMSFHTAAIAPWQLYDIVPYSFAAAIMLGLIGWMFCREKRA